MAAICVDAGTTVVKAVGYDEAGAEVAVARHQTGVSRPAPGWAEQDMTTVWDAVARTVRDVAARTEGPIDFLAVTAQGDGVWLVDPAGEPTGNAILWNDGRAAATVDAWARSGVAERAFRLNGNVSASGLPHAILSWLREHDPDRLDRSAAGLTCGGWIFSRLTGEIATDESDASAPFMDLRTRAYSPELMAMYGLEWAERLLPEPRDDTRRVAALTTGAAESLGLPAGTPVVMAPYDIASTAIGAGAVRPGQACGILGTTLCTETVADRPDLDGEPVGVTLAIPGGYLRAFPTFSGGEVIQWACRLLGLPGPAELGELAAQSPPGARGLAFLPYLSPAGERVPFSDPLARGSFLGLSFEHGREHIARAVLEGLSLVVQDCLAVSGVAAQELRVCGGGSANALWVRMISDITGLPVHRSSDAEVGARGAFIVGLVATGAAPGVEVAADRFVRLSDAVHPDPGPYDTAYQDFLALRANSARSWPLLAETRDRTWGRT
ncbi:FGGY-family carbohydrate kinase [Nonomuraea cavernae]|uniref:Carbohydrate kinase n=1 Tax=Nonomuraea cavernae TaxID=2045107 RepID=A0A917YS21_9ACTN|nr:FGGY-family carbohydrate kinase [Nonomuraea cavernae]MCA2185066.1 carbohydrate kinase [Nonomuraea cavernae]GGO65303.1 carbohydrate kinase [Nonomuraea cavernae]